MELPIKSSIKRIKHTVEYFPLLVSVMRIVVGLAVFVFYLFQPPQYIILYRTPFYIWLAAYTIFIILMLLKNNFYSNEDNKIQIEAPKYVDIAMMIALTYISGGVHTGFGMLILPFIATSSFNSSRYEAMSYASFATILLFVLSFFNILSDHNDNITAWHLLLQTGLLSASCFLVSLFTSWGSINISRTLSLVEKNEQRIAQMDRLNSTVLENAHEGIIVFDHNGKTVLFNQQAVNIFKYIRQNDTVKELGDILAFWHSDPYQVFSDTCMCCGQKLIVHAMPLMDEEPIMLLTSIRSLEEVAQETQSHKLASLGQLTVNLAHEIRNPLSAISHANELLQENNIDEVDEHLKNIIEHNVHRIDTMIDEILSLGRRSMDKKSISIKKFLFNFIHEFFLSNPKSIGCIAIEMKLKDATVFADEGHLLQILNNLINNAWKYCRKNERAIVIEVRESSNKQEVIISVSDNGSGVKPENENRIFEPFFTTSQSGTGLGLYVAQALAAANDGNLRYHRAEQGGACFELTLKLDKRVK